MKTTLRFVIPINMLVISYRSPENTKKYPLIFDEGHAKCTN